MSTVRVVNLQHPDSVEPNVILNTDGTATFASGVTVSGFNNISVSGTAQFASGTAASPSLTFEGDSDTGIYTPAGDILAFTASGVEQARLTTSGTNLPKLAIGNTDPEAILNLGSYTGPSQLIRMRTSSGQVVGLDMGDSSDPDGGRVRYHLSDSSLRFFTESNVRIRVDSDGLKFGADTAAANALDDYEEGTWTPSITSGITSPSLTTANGNYTKIGRTLFFNFEIRVNSGTPNSSVLIIGGLPYASAAIAQNFASVNINFNNILTGFSELRAGHVSTGASSVQFYNGTGQILGNSSGVQWLNGRRLIAAGFLMTA
jgi:hypothetical protein